MASSVSLRKRIRKNFGQHDVVASIPNLIEVQKTSYAHNFLQLGVSLDKLENRGLHCVFNSVFPIEDYNREATLEYVKYHFEDPKYDVSECKQRGLSFSAPLKVTLRLIVWDIDKDTGLRDVKGIKEQKTQSINVEIEQLVHPSE